MKITSIRTHYVRIPFDMGAPRQDFAGLRFPTMDHLLVQVDTDAGITGWGEAFGHTIIPATKAALEAYVGPWFIGKDATDINTLHREAAQAFHIFGRNGPVVYAHSGVDIALWDIAGKRAGLPLCDLRRGCAHRGRAASIQLRSLVAKDVAIVVQADAKGAYGDGVDGLLGMSFLSHFKLSMDTQTLRVSRR